MKISICRNITLLTLFVALAGCGGGGSSSPLEGSSVDTQDATQPAISWYSAAQPLIERHCMTCHVDGGLAPFPLKTYEHVYNKRSAMMFALEGDIMPPEGFTDLPQRDLALLLQWLADGAPEGDSSQAPDQNVVSGFTYHGDTRAIIEKNCVTCHVEGGVAPFPLDSYDKIKSVAAAALFAIDTGIMPPWPPTVGYSRFVGERVLPPEEEFALRNWLAGGLEEGNPEDYVAPENPDSGKTFAYNIQMPIPEPYTPTLRPDDHRCFAMEWPLDELAYVKSVNVIPDQIAEVHHVIVNIIDPQDRHFYAGAGGEDGRPGWHCLGSGGIDGAPLPRQIGGWVPGLGNGEVPEGTGLTIQPGSLLVVQLHYNTLVAEPTPDQSIIQIATVSEVERPASGFLYTNPAFLGGGVMIIPAGDPDVHHEFSVPSSLLLLVFGGPAGLKPDEPFALHNGFLHMHNLGKTGRTTLIRADGTEQVILDVRDWDFNWQSAYGLAEELLVQPADRLKLECSWDNSAENQVIVDGQQLPPRDVDWSDGTGDEMCLTNFYVTKPKEGHDYSYSASVYIQSPSYRQQFAPGDPVPLELLFNNFKLQEPDAANGLGAEDGGDHSGNVYSGHYYVYLDTDDDNAAHLTAWDENYFYQLPADIAPGTHTLRVSLRGPDHHALAIEQSVTIEVREDDVVQPLQLITVDDWTIQPANEDSLSGHRPVEVVCPDNSWYNDDGALEVETGNCNYLSLSQPGNVAVATGDELHIVLWHGDLAFEQPATAHAAISIGGEIVWEADVDIPTKAELFDVRVPIDFDAPAGSKVEFHLHNHGYNAWTLLQMEIER